MATHITLKATLSPMFQVIQNLDDAIISADAALEAAIADEEPTMLRIAKLEAKERVYAKYLEAEENVSGVERKNEASPEPLVDSTMKRSRTSLTAENDGTYIDVLPHHSSIVDETKAAVASYLASPAPTLADLMAIVDVVDDAHTKVLEAMKNAIHLTQVEADECDEREKSYQEALASVQEQIDTEVHRTEMAHQARKELDTAVPRISSVTTKELQGRQPSSRKRKAEKHLA